MRSLSRLESLIAEIVERPAWLLGPRRLHPLEITAGLERALEARALRLADRVLAPDAYDVRLNPDDFAAYGDAAPSLARELASYLARTITERDLTCNRPPSVSLRPDPAVRHRRVAVDAHFSESATGEAPPTVFARPRQAPPVSAPRRIRPEGAHAASLDLAGPRLLVQDADERVVQRLALDRLPATIGRQSGCEITLLDPKVSRQHARLERGRDGIVLTDLGSLNGTLVNGHALHGATLLRDGDVIQIGRLRLRFQVGPGAGG